MAKGDASGGAPSPDASGGGGMMGRIGQGMGQMGNAMGRMGGIGYGGMNTGSMDMPSQGGFSGRMQGPGGGGFGGFMGNLGRMGAQMGTQMGAQMNQAPQGGGTMQGSIGGMPMQGNPMFQGMSPQVARLFQMYSQGQRPQY